MCSGVFFRLFSQKWNMLPDAWGTSTRQKHMNARAVYMEACILLVDQQHTHKHAQGHVSA